MLFYYKLLLLCEGHMLPAGYIQSKALLYSLLHVLVPVFNMLHHSPSVLPLNIHDSLFCGNILQIVDP